MACEPTGSTTCCSFQYQQQACSVQPLTLRFSNGAHQQLEAAYVAHRFRESYPTTVAFCAVLALVIGFLAVGVPALEGRPFGGRGIFGAVAFLFLLGLREWVHHADDQHARKRFAWGNFAVWAVFAAAQQRFVLVDRLSDRAFAAALAVGGMAALLQRATALPAVPRMLAIAAVVLANYNLKLREGSSDVEDSSSHTSQQPPEMLVISAALLTGELIGHPLELRWRAAFAREASHGRVPDASVDESTVHPITLCFASRELEQPYATRYFRENYSVVLVCAAGSLVLLAMLSLAVPAALPLAGCIMVIESALASARVCAHHATDQVNAHTRFAWLWCALWTFGWAAFWAAQRRFVLIDCSVRCLSGREFLGPVAFSATFALWQRFIAIPVIPRMLVLTAHALAHLTSAHSQSELGSSIEGILIIQAVLALSQN